MQPDCLEKLETARTLAQEFARQEADSNSIAQNSPLPTNSLASETATTQPLNPASATPIAVEPSRPPKTLASEIDPSLFTQSTLTTKPVEPQSKKLHLGANFNPDAQLKEPKISAFELAHWRNRLWLNPFLALSALLWLPFATGLFSNLIWLNLLVLCALSLVEYQVTRKTCRALHSVKAPLWQRSWILFSLRRAIIIGTILAVFVLSIPYESSLLSLYLTLLALYWLAQAALYQRRRRQQRQQTLARLA